MGRFVSILLTGIAIGSGIAGIARADNCETVLAAFTALSKAPAYHQTISAPGVALEMIAIGDVLYVKDDAEWMKLPVTPGMREQMFKQMVPDATALQDCRALGSETLDGVETNIYEYLPPAVEGAGELGLQRVWIADADGLPRRMYAEQDGEAIDVRISYGDVTAPCRGRGAARGPFDTRRGMASPGSSGREPTR